MQYSFPMEDRGRVLKIVMSPSDWGWQHVADSYRKDILRTEQYEPMSGLSELLVKYEEANETVEIGRTNFYFSIADPFFIESAVSKARQQLREKMAETTREERKEEERFRNSDSALSWSRLEQIGTTLDKMRQTRIGMREEENLLTRLYKQNNVVLEFEPCEDIPKVKLDARTMSVSTG